MYAHSTYPTANKRGSAAGVLVLHVALFVLLLQSDVLQRVLPKLSPVTVSLLSVTAPEKPLAVMPVQAATLPAPARRTVPPMPLLAPPTVELLAAPTLTDAVTEAPSVATPVAAPAPVPVPTQPATALAAPPVLAEPRQLPPGAITYRVPPAVAVPLASRRLRESGTVWLRVRVDRQGLPAQISLHKSSGFARLDEQALAAMQVARFTPQTENGQPSGQPIEWVVIAPLAYDID